MGRSSEVAVDGPGNVYYPIRSRTRKCYARLLVELESTACRPDRVAARLLTLLLIGFARDVPVADIRRSVHEHDSATCTKSVIRELRS